MQRRDNRQPPVRFQRLTGKNRTNRMRDGVMNVKQIKILAFGHGRHLGCQRQRVWLVLKERIRHHFDFMKAHSLIQFSQSRWQR